MNKLRKHGFHSPLMAARCPLPHFGQHFSVRGALIIDSRRSAADSTTPSMAAAAAGPKGVTRESVAERGGSAGDTTIFSRRTPSVWKVTRADERKSDVSGNRV